MITWKELKALNDIFTKGKSSAKIQDHAYIKHIIETKDYFEHPEGNNKILLTTNDFDLFFKKTFLKPFNATKEFLESEEIETSAKKNFTLDDIKTLMLVAENRQELSSKLTNIEDFSSKIFESSKYLKGKTSVRNAVCKILGIDEFPLERKDHQWRLVIDNRNPKAIILCENKSFLRQPWIAKENQIKLWYVGGNNIKQIDDIDEIELSRPIFYSCDWDLAGLQIYSRIKKKLKERKTEIKVLYPNHPHKEIPTKTLGHKSYWNTKNLSGLIKDDFNQIEVELINKLIKKDKWIEEESTDLEMMISEVLMKKK
jgi:5S rRNA maturation endonuclease (ribonuclease M5)